ncbi:cancer-related nucleoside-triphosphatase isoform X2 [Meriones unguiculatus]|uniref:cancer-related nucleoside-triphosphatase isoform X2 n=1 Tax=Meriones unguiculatus TaxID=10047 RepID=UPI00293E027B|nr:cancer-related nucleoside-triphosphatase isoform X2 [Meriones unguiculatus]
MHPGTVSRELRAALAPLCLLRCTFLTPEVIRVAVQLKELAKQPWSRKPARPCSPPGSLWMDFTPKKSYREGGGSDLTWSRCPVLEGPCPEFGTAVLCLRGFVSSLARPRLGAYLLFVPQIPSEKHEYRVGQYVVDLASFEQLALPALRNAGSGRASGHKVCIIDEIGKMELFSQPFIQAVRRILSTPGTVVLGTFPVPKGKPLAVVEEIWNRCDVKVYSVTKENRNSLLPDIVSSLQRSRP